MNAIQFLFELNSQTQEWVQAGYPDSSGVPNTWLREYDAERYFPLIGRASIYAFNGASSLNRDKKVLQKLWDDCFRYAIQHAARRPGNKPLQSNLERVESLYLFSSVLASVALTAHMNKDDVFEFVGGMFQEEQMSDGISRESVYGLPYGECSNEQRFFRKALRVSIASYGRVETLTPMLTNFLPSQSGELFNPLIHLDNVFSDLPRGWRFEEVSDRLAFQALELSWRYSQALKLQEYSDEDFFSFGFEDDWE